MSGFELDRQVLADKLPLGKDLQSQNGKDDVNRMLLSQLKQSSDIARDLASLYADRPYVYARVMKQLSSVLGGAKVRKLHNEVKARAKTLSERAVQNAKAMAKTSLRSSTGGGNKGSGENDGGGTETESKKITLNVPALGIHGKEIELKSESGSYQIGCDGWGCPFLNLASATAVMNGKDLDRIELNAGLKGKFIKEGSSSGAQVTIKHHGNSSFTASGSLDADLDIPGIEGLKGTFVVGADETARVTATISGNGTMFNKTLELSSDVTMHVGETSDFSGSLTVNNSTLAGDAGAAAVPAAPSADGEAGAGSGPMNFTGTITVEAAASAITSMTGDITISNLGFLADPGESIKLDVSYNGESFSATLGSAVSFKEHQLDDKKSSITLTINSADYTDEALGADCTVVGKLGDLLTVTGNASFAQNALQAGSLTIDVPAFAVPKENSFIDGSMTGTANFDASGFTGATAEANLNLKIGTSTCQLQLTPFEVSATGVVSGHVEQIESFTYGCITAEEFKADFSTDNDAIISDLSGILRVDHKYLKSDEAGIPVTFDGTTLKANGNLSFVENEKDEIGTCEFEASVTAEGFSGSGTLTLSKDYQVGSSKLQLCEGATATVGIENETLSPITFSGDYKYGYAIGGGEGGDAGGADAGATDAGGAETDATGTDLKFSGKVTNCVFEPETGMLSGSATAKLDSTIKIGSDSLFVELESSFRQNETQLEIAFAESALTSVSGTIVAKAGIKLKNDNLVLEGYLKNFTYDVAGNSFTGIVDVGLNENFDLDADKTVVLQGKKQNGIKVTLAANVVTDIEADLDVELNPKSTMFKGKPKFDCEAKNMKIDPQSGAINCDPITVKCAKDAVICLHENQTEITLDKGSSLTTAIVDSEPTYLTGDITYSGETSIFKKGDVKDFKFDGTVNINIADVKDPGAEMTGSVTMNVSDNYVMDSIPDVDEIDLMAGTNVKVDLTQDGLTDIDGDFTIRYIYNAGQNEHLPGGLKLDLKGTGLHYNVPGQLFSGTISVNAVDNVVFNIDSAGESTFTLVGPASGFNASIEENKLNSLDGTVGFLSHLKIGEEGALDIVEGSNATLNIDVSTFAINSLTVTSNITCDFKAGSAQVKTDEAITADCTIDAEGLSNASITGAAHLIIPVNDNDLDLVVAAGGEGMKYTRDGGVNGDIKVTCESRTELGSFTRTGKDGAVSTFKYGLGQAGEGGEGGEGGGAAAGFTATVSNNELQKVAGFGGFFLEQDAEADPLKVSGNVEFECAITPAISLTKASGDIKIERKTLFGSPETLVLGESTAQINIANNQLVGITGDLQLFLNDNGGSADGGGDYLVFTATGDFDCLDSKTFTGDVTASIIREKQLGSDIATSQGKSFGIYLSPEAGDTGFETKITENVIEEASGNLGVMTKLDGEPFFSGSVNGSYKAASEGVESSLNGTGTIKLLQDIDMLDGKFRICKGSNGTATIENNDISTLSGEITIAIAAPNKSFDEACIKVTATSTVDVKEAKITEFVGTASLTGAFPITEGLSLTSLGATVSIHDNELDEISGSASIKFEKGGFTIEGACNSFRWVKGGEGGDDGFSFSGSLSVKGMDNKLTGTATVTYDTIGNPTAAPVIDGKLGYKFNEWLSGEIGLRFDGSGWDDPVLYGSLKVDNATLIPGRQLLGFSPEPKDLFSLSYGLINFGAGIGLGFSVDLDPVTFSAEFDVEDFHLGKDAGIPKFETDLELKSGLSLKATISPYVKFSLGVGGVIEAGIKVKGVASLSADADLTLSGKLKGGEDGLSGEVGLGFDVSGGVTLSVVPSIFATFFDNKAESDITKWDFDLGNIFNFSWGKRYGFDKSGTHELGDADKTALTPTATCDASAEGKEEIDESYAPQPAPAKQEDGPELPDSKQVADEANQSQDGESAGGDFADKMDKISKIATAFGNIAEAVSFVAELVTAAITGNVAGVVIFLVIKIIKGELDITAIPQKVTEIIEGIQALKELIEENPDFLESLMPEWLKNVINFFKNLPTIPELCNMIVEKVTEKVAALGSPLCRILQPLVDFVAAQAEKICEIYELFEKGGVDNIVKGIFSIIGLGFSCLEDLISALQSMWNICCQIVRECIASGDIYVKYKENGWTNYYYWHFSIPGLFTSGGEGGFPSWDHGIAKLMLWTLEGAGLKAQKIG